MIAVVWRVVCQHPSGWLEPLSGWGNFEDTETLLAVELIRGKRRVRLQNSLESARSRPGQSIAIAGHFHELEPTPKPLGGPVPDRSFHGNRPVEYRGGGIPSQEKRNEAQRRRRADGSAS